MREDIHPAGLVSREDVEIEKNSARSKQEKPEAQRAGRPLPEGIGDDPATVMFTRIDAAGVSYLVEVDAVDPCRALAAVAAPVLIVQGGRDFSVREHHAKRLRDARGDRATETVFFPELQHFYKVVDEDVDPMAAFSIDTESDPAVSDAIDLWLRRIIPSEP